MHRERFVRQGRFRQISVYTSHRCLQRRLKNALKGGVRRVNLVACRLPDFGAQSSYRKSIRLQNEHHTVYRLNMFIDTFSRHRIISSRCGQILFKFRVKQINGDIRILQDSAETHSKRWKSLA